MVIIGGGIHEQWVGGEAVDARANRVGARDGHIEKQVVVFRGGYGPEVPDTEDMVGKNIVHDRIGAVVQDVDGGTTRLRDTHDGVVRHAHAGGGQQAHSGAAVRGGHDVAGEQRVDPGAGGARV